jgi:hypothetical protein
VGERCDRGCAGWAGEMSLPHGYTNATTVQGERVVKRYVGRDAAERMWTEMEAIRWRRLGERPPKPLTGPKPAAVSSSRPLDQSADLLGPCPLMRWKLGGRSPRAVPPPGRRRRPPDQVDGDA